MDVSELNESNIQVDLYFSYRHSCRACGKVFKERGKLVLEIVPRHYADGITWYCRYRKNDETARSLYRDNPQDGRSKNLFEAIQEAKENADHWIGQIEQEARVFERKKIIEFEEKKINE